LTVFVARLFVGPVFFCTTTLIVVTLIAGGGFVVVEMLVVLAAFDTAVVVVVGEAVDDVDDVDDVAVDPMLLDVVATVAKGATEAFVVDVAVAGEITGGARITGAEVEDVTIGANVNGAVVVGVGATAGAIRTPPPALPPVLPPEPRAVGS
jgi:hypothetical protein